MPSASRTDTVKVWATPAVVGDGKATWKPAGLTRTAGVLPTIVPSDVSVAVIDWTPAESRMAPNE